MPNGYYGGAPNAFLGGVEFAAAQRRRMAEENALRSMIQQYGPEAADPVRWGQVAGIQQRAELHPLAVRQQEQSVAANDAALADQERQRLMGAGRNAAFFLERAKQLGMDPGEAFDRVARILPALGVNADQLSTIREQIVSDPNGIDSLVAMFRGEQGAVRATGNPVPVYDRRTGQLQMMQQFSDGTTRIIDDVVPATAMQAEERLRQGSERLGLGWSNLQFDKLEAFLPAREAGVQNVMGPDGRVVAELVPGSPAEQKFEQNLREANANDRKLIQAFGVSSDHANVVGTNAQRALQYFGGADGGVILQNIRRGARLVPGTEAYSAWDALEAIKNNIAIDELQRMRQSSPTGGAMGNVSDRDISLLTGALGRLEVERDPARMVEDIRTIQEVYGRIMQFAREDAEAAQYRMQLRQQRGSGGVAAPAPAQAPVPSAELSDEDLLRKYLP
jgi:hypothetical protein